jgi:hypothetical protein
MENDGIQTRDHRPAFPPEVTVLLGKCEEGVKKTERTLTDGRHQPSSAKAGDDRSPESL